MFGSIIHLHPKLSYSFVLRNYSTNYQALQSSAFGENSKGSNEKGFYSGAQLKLPKNFMLAVYADYFIFPWLKFGVDAPGSGYEYLAQLKWKPKRSFESYLQFKTKSQEQNASDKTAKFNLTETRKHSSLRWNIRIKLNETWDWGSRIEQSFYKRGVDKNSLGFMMYQDILFHPLNSNIALGFRYAIFDTDDYDTRIYAYENDVLFSYSIPAMQGKGSRMYFNLKYRLSRMMEIWIRYSVSTFINEQPGANPTDGSKDPKKEIKAQIRFRF